MCCYPHFTMFCDYVSYMLCNYRIMQQFPLFSINSQETVNNQFKFRRLTVEPLAAEFGTFPLYTNISF